MEVIAIIVGSVTIGFSYWVYSHNRYQKIFTEVCNAMNLTLIPGNIFQFAKIKGHWLGCEVRVERPENKDKFENIKLFCSLDVGSSGYINIAKESPFNRVQRVLGIHDIETGDKEFDAQMKLSSDSSHLLIPLLDFKTRELISRLSQRLHSIEINNTGFSAILKASHALEAWDFEFIIKKMVSVSNSMSDDKPLQERMIENIKTDPLAEYRLKNLQLMTSQFAIDKEGKATLTACLKDSDLDVQIEAAGHLGKKGMTHLVKILKDQDSWSQGLYPLDIVGTLKDIIGHLKDNKYQGSISVLKKKYLETEYHKVKIFILETFSEMGLEKLSPFLIEELEKDESQYRSHLIDALGSCGRVEAVEKLFKIGKSTLNPLLRNSVKEAITKIQSRLGDVDKGWLSLKELDEIDGALSMAGKAGDGSLSLPESNAETGALSLPEEKIKSRAR